MNELWNKLEDFKIDKEDSEFKFSDRLCRENGWSESYTDRVIEEYKKFIYLAATSQYPVTPSEDIDEVWHLHLCYTQSYWNELCGQILTRPLHHDPTKGGEAESEKYKSQYTKTLEFYKETFNEIPPQDIWPEVELRFNSKNYVQKVNLHKYLLIQQSHAIFILLFNIILLYVFGFTSFIQEFRQLEPVHQIVFIGTIIFLVLLFFFSNKITKKIKGCGAGGNFGCGGGCGGSCGGGCGGGGGS